MLSLKQKEILKFVNEYQLVNSHPPTLDEIARYFKKSIPTIHQHIQALRTKGFLKLPGINSRGIEVYNQNEEIAEIPLMGYVSAGGGVEANENPEPIKVQRSMLSPTGQHYALLVRGISMIDDGILPDDIIIVKHQNNADNGDVVIALFEDNGTFMATVKRFYNHGNIIELRPKNPSLSPKMYNLGEIEIRGKFVGLLRHGG